MPQTTVSNPIKEITDSLTELLDFTLTTGMNVFQTLTKSGTDITSKLAPAIKSLPLPSMGGCCKIPPPCWMPRELSAVASHVCPGGSATLRLRITNCGLGIRSVSAEADHGATVSPASIQIAPLHRGWLTVTYNVPAAETCGQSTEILVLIRGCKDYYLRWTIAVSDRGCQCCHEIDVEDCPDLIHHWYDHFYCVRACPSDQARVIGR